MSNGKHLFYKKKYLQSKDIKYKILYKFYKKRALSININKLFGGAHELVYKKDFHKYCQPNKFEQCIKNIHNLRTMVEPYNIYRTVLQGMWIKDVIGTKKLVNEVLINKFGFNINYLEISFENQDDNDDIVNVMNNILADIKGDNIYLIQVYLRDHVNIIYVDTYYKRESTKASYKGSVYIYEPHLPEKLDLTEYSVYIQLQKIYEDNNINVLKLPERISKQSNLSLSYMYVLHFYIYIFVTRNESEKNTIYKDWSIDNIYIMNFTGFILKLSNEYELIGDIDYYILTNNTFQIQNLITRDTQINDLLLKVSSNLMIRILYRMSDNILLGSFVHIVYQGEQYIDQLCNNISNIINVPNKTTQQMIELRVIVLEMQSLFPQCNNKNFKSFIFKTNNMEKLPETNNYYSGIIKSQIKSNDFNILMYAAKEGNLNLTRFLVLKNANINLQNKDGSTALMFAVNEGHENVVKLLLYNNANTDLQNKDGWTALILAANKGYEGIIKLLLEKKANVDLQNNNGWTALMIAVDNRYKNIVKLLLSYGAHTDIRNDEDDSAFEVALENGDLNMVKILRNYMNVV